MTKWRASPNGKRALIACVWLLAVVLFASQWYLYDAVHRDAERFIYYLGTCAYLCGVISPLVFWLSRTYFIDSRAWKRSLPVHFAASLLVTALGVFVEASIGWLPHAGNWAFSAALRHYFTQHTQISLLAYWALLAVFQIYRMYDQARLRELHAAQLEAQLTEAQLTALRTQLQPHFLFNTLQAATTLIYDDPQGAEEILLSLGELLRISLQDLQQQEVPLRNEIEFLRHYAAIQQRRFGDRLRFEFVIDKASESCAVPSLLLQPLVENAVRHGVGVRKQPDLISVHALVDQGRLTIEITNRASKLNDTPERLISRGVGLANTIARLERLYGPRQSFAIRNLSPQGVLVSLSIPARLMPLPIEELPAQAIG
ncbi:MAG TPA: histidine kinase [Bryobacteraceae bacterium]|jgi:LytS/YehU family sensor histidine kinase|nr:histidine kinase [Bryobacteraceae bacterium]